MNDRMYEVAQEIYKEHIERGITNDTTCDITLIPDYGYETDSKEANEIEDQVNFLIINNK